MNFNHCQLNAQARLLLDGNVNGTVQGAASYVVKGSRQDFSFNGATRVLVPLNDGMLRKSMGDIMKDDVVGET